ncbi:hypothetical protein IAQ67_29320 (plasmid) [Paenibacillus peoriae]|uniref:Uncharacterized protein n=1 Tax=Paenibacillus peoriae TaxID=59893 RepID=A0A7H0YHK2_9BACL|nr:hypothetical protein [Paenibacillus peoriae]QNR70560.1 hypothetical protein IAQ67_29320 [Paenibacillus peoriae]
MIFEVTKDSTLFDEKPSRPMEEAKKIEGREGWFVELETLEELIALQEKYGALELTISFKHQNKVINIPDHN